MVCATLPLPIDSDVGRVESSVTASWLPILSLDLVEPRDSESTLLNLDLPVGLFDFLAGLPSLFNQASMAFLRTVVITLFDLKSAGLPPVMKMRPPSLSGSLLAGAGGLLDVSCRARPGVDHVSVRWTISL